ncbi:MBG domain-containing protein [Galbibacter sp. PAP.153]|uniref:MBG domain-containing protein n=1 Tax=Galbibacter sp. PAP.153 TaxID=3104623 RepID=UPI003009334F
MKRVLLLALCSVTFFYIEVGFSQSCMDSQVHFYGPILGYNKTFSINFEMDSELLLQSFVPAGGSLGENPGQITTNVTYESSNTSVAVISEKASEYYIKIKGIGTSIIKSHYNDDPVDCSIAFTLKVVSPVITPSPGNILYVNKNVSGGNQSGNSWNNAIHELSDALSWVRSNWDVDLDGNLEIWVAQGLYMPVTPTDLNNVTDNERKKSFSMRKGVAIYGGLSGTESTSFNMDTRDWQAHPTVLSGDIDRNDSTDGNGVLTSYEDISGVNSYRIFDNSSLDTSAILDGFIITGGNANGALTENEITNGGGMYNGQSSPTLKNLIFSGNSAILYGGAMINSNVVVAGVSSNPIINNVTFTGNHAGESGGAIWNDIGNHPSLVNATFSNNLADHSGGAIYNSEGSHPTIHNSLFKNNISIIGGAMANMGNLGLDNSLPSASPTILNSVFSGNMAISDGGGGAIYNLGIMSPTIVNCTFTKNVAEEEGGAIYNLLSSPLIKNSIIWDNEALGSTSIPPASVYTNSGGHKTFFSNSIIANFGGSSTWDDAMGIDGGNNIDIDPEFVDTVPGTTEYLFLKKYSPAVNKGSNQAYIDAGGNPTTDVDLAGKQRLYNGSPTNDIIDMGAYELHTDPVPFVKNVSSPEAIAVAYGTALTEINNLPTEATAILNNENEVIVSLDRNTANWTLLTPSGGVFNAEVAGTYVFNIPLILPEEGDIPYFANPDEISAQVTIKVLKGSPELTVLWDGINIDLNKGLLLTYGDQGTLTIESSNPNGSFSYTLEGDASNILNLNDLKSVFAQQVGNGILTIEQEATENFEAITKQIDVIVEQKQITILTESDQGKTYGSPDPEHYGFVLDSGSFLAEGDGLTDIVSESRREMGENVGNYNIKLELNGVKASNYNITFQEDNDAFVISPKLVTIVADYQKKKYGASDPELTYTASPSLIGNDNFEGMLAREKGEAVGTYSIDQGSLKLSNNYTINYSSGTLEITKAPLTITAENTSKVFGEADPELTYKVMGFVNGDGTSIITGKLSRETGEDAGTYPITLGNLNAGENYDIYFEASSLEVVKADQNIVWNQQLSFGCGSGSQVSLTASANSGLPISYVVSNNSIAEVSGNVLTHKRSGAATIMAMQSGDKNHNPATSIQKTLLISQGGLIRQHWDDVLMFDNSNGNFVGYQWYKNGTAVLGATQQYYSENTALNGSYYVEAFTESGEVITSCPLELSRESVSRRATVIPNPVMAGSEFVLDGNFEEPLLNGASINIIDFNGRVLQTVPAMGSRTRLTAPMQTGIYVVLLSLSNGERKTVNLLVK